MRYCMIMFGLALVILAPSAGCEKRKSPKPSLGEVERLPKLETIVLGKPKKLVVKRSYTATVEAYEKADLKAMVKGYVASVPADLDIGRAVKKDEPLLTLEAPDLIAERNNKKALVEQSVEEEARAVQAIAVADAEVKESQASLARFMAEIDFRKSQLVRVAKLAQGDTLSQQQVEEARLQLAAAEAALSGAKAQVLTKQSRYIAAQKERLVAAARARAATAEFAKAQVQVEFATIRAPFDGIITKRWVDSGTTIKDAGMSLFTCMRVDKVRVVIDVPERDVSFLQAGAKGNKVVLTFPALKDVPGAEKLNGKISLLSAALDPVTRTMRTEIHVDNKIAGNVGLLRPQMTGTAVVNLAAREAYTVPAASLVRTGNKMELFIVTDPSGDPPRGLVKRIEVETGLDDGLRVEIRNDNLTGNELIVAKGAGVLRPGDEVIAVKAK